MKGSYDVVVSNNRVQFKFTVKRNITIVRGKSGTGKTTLADMISDFEQNGQESGVFVKCDKPCRVLRGNRWQDELDSIKDSIVFVDEGNRFIESLEFARALKDSDNYYVLSTRVDLPMLPYSVDEIYELDNVGRSKYPPFKRIYTHFKQMYRHPAPLEKPDVLIVEDSNAGYEFFSALCSREGIECISAGGRSRIFDIVHKCNHDDSILVVADGAAFGPEMERLMSLRWPGGISLFLPESFEWLILKSGLVRDEELSDLLENPSDFIESRDYFSWERFFNAELVRRTTGNYLHYNKRRLNAAYLGDREMKAIEAQLPAAIVADENKGFDSGDTANAV